MTTSNGKTSGLYPALLAVQQELPKLQKDSINPHYKNKYISLDSLMAAIRPVLSKHGLLWVTQPCRDESGEPALSYQLVHAESGESAGSTMPLMMAKSDPQGQGSAITYARRYSITAMLGLVADEDDDGHKATEGRQKAQRAAQTSGNGAGSRLLNADERQRVLTAIEGAKQDAQLTFAAVGVSQVEDLTVEHAQKIHGLLHKDAA